ncbi:MAG: DHH family phosphoesterase [Clostridia bacterium]
MITDHREITPDENGADVLPAADAILNPHRQDCAYPYKQLCGAGVAFKLMEALYERQKQDKRQLENLLGLAALATICDVCPLLGKTVGSSIADWNSLNTNPITDSRAHGARR